MICKEELLSQVKELPGLPVSVAKISALCTSENSGMGDLEEALRPDPGLTANILKLANSAYFGLPCQVTSVRQAVTFLGTKKVLQVAMGGTFSRLIPPVLPGYGIDAAAFWRHSIAVAVLSERMNAELGVGAGENIFTCGLLHDIGKLVTSSYLAQESTAVAATLKREACSFVEAERDLLGLDHCEVGAALAAKWNFPEDICAVARWHHAPEPGGSGVVDVVHVANCLAHAMGYGADLGELSRHIDPDVLRRLNAPMLMLEKIVCDSASSIDSMSEIHTHTEGGQ